jgi:ABC-type uncharacterized transport system substrate-binding protein
MKTEARLNVASRPLQERRGRSEAVSSREAAVGAQHGRRRLATLSSASSSTLAYEEQKSQVLAAADALGREVIVLETRSNRDYEANFKMLVQRQARALSLGPFAFPNPNEIIALAGRYKVPTIYPNIGWVKAGGLMSYTSDDIEGLRHAGIYVGRILKGEKPADLAGDRDQQVPTRYQPQDGKGARP